MKNPLSTQDSAVEAIPVTVENFIRAETDMYFAMFVGRGALGGFVHYRELPPIALPSVRPNRDTLYSHAVFDLDAGPVEITLPDPGERFMSMIVIDQDHYVLDVHYGAGTHTLTRQQVGTRYVFTSVRTFFDPHDPADVEQVHFLQDAINVRQAECGTFEVPTWDRQSQTRVRDALLTLATTLPDMRHGGGRPDEVDPVRRLIAAAAAWGLNPDQDALYLNFTPADNYRTGMYRLTMKDVPVDGFWSISVYDSEGHFVKNPREAYSLNNVTATTDADGAVTIHFGGCDDNPGNCLPIFPGWNYMVRLYRPRATALDGTYVVPRARRTG